MKPPDTFSVTIGENCAREMRTFHDLAEKLKMPVEDLMRQCKGKAPPTKALVKGLAKELGIDEKLLEKLAEVVRQDLALSRLYNRPIPLVDHNVGVKLIVLDRPVKLPVPPSKWYPAIDLVVDQQDGTKSRLSGVYWSQIPQVGISRDSGPSVHYREAILSQVVL